MHLIEKCPRKSKIKLKLRVGLAVPKFFYQSNILTVLIHNLKTIWPTKISIPFLSSFDNLLKGDNFEKAH